MIRLLKNLRKRDYLFMFLAFVLIVLQVFFDLRIPEYMSKITVLINSEGALVNDVLIQGLYMLICALSGGIFAIGVSFLVALIGSDLAYSLREKTYSKIQDFSVKEIKNFSVASLITRTTNDINQVQHTLTMGLQSIIKAPILAVWAVSKILNKSLQLSFVPAVAIVILLVMVVVISSIAMPKFKLMQKLTDNLNKITREHLTGVRVVKAFNAEEYQEEKFASANKSLTNTYLFTDRIMGFLSPMMSTVTSGMSLAIYWIGALIVNGTVFNLQLSVFSDVVTFMNYSMQVVAAFVMLTMMFIMLPRAMVSAKRINEVLELNSSIIEGDFTGQTTLKGKIEFKNVSFKYPDADEFVIKDVSFTVNPGETIAFIGSTGSGKSTLINLIPRFYDVTEGEILVDGINVKDYNLKTLYNKLGYVFQTAVMFKGSVKQNLTLGDSLNRILEEDISLALSVSQSQDFVSNMQDGVDSELTQGGKNVSGGQRQRLSIARAIAKKPEIFIFDDTFSALDYKTDKELRAALNNTLKGTTKLIVAQRIGTIKNADKILVLNEGVVVGYGKHEELLNNCEVYKEIALSQLSKEEL